MNREGNITRFLQEASGGDRESRRALLSTKEDGNSRHRKVFECRIFSGMTIEESAAAVGDSSATFKRAWLSSRLSQSGESPDGARAT